MASGASNIASNRKALHDYHVLERFETGIELRGTEVKSLREGHVSLVGAFAQIKNGEVFLEGMTIQPYEFGNRFNHDSDRPRRLLLHKREILRLKAESEQKGHSLIPLRLYFKGRNVKVELGSCRGKNVVDKRETLKRKTADREAGRAIANARRR
ncbi:MAG: SsrA-binding protein SmpB [Verrucomicrobia bacterium]|jgi:SsrA-binding protein|nr:SsrA-binding protein SmpB [Verrucomicrobiota bacterium]